MAINITRASVNVFAATIKILGKWLNPKTYYFGIRLKAGIRCDLFLRYLQRYSSYPCHEILDSTALKGETELTHKNRLPTQDHNQTGKTQGHSQDCNFNSPQQRNTSELTSQAILIIKVLYGFVGLDDRVSKSFYKKGYREK